MLIDIVAFDGIDEMDVIGPLEVFRSAALLAAVEARLVTRLPQDVVVGAYGTRLLPDGVLVPGAADVLLVPGGGWILRADAGAWGEVRRGDLLPVVKEAAEAARLTTAVCTGSLVLAHAGVVGNRRVATHHGACADLAATGATVLPDRVVDDGDLITAGGVTSGIDLAMWVLEREFGFAVAERVASRMEYTRARPAQAEPVIEFGASPA